MSENLQRSGELKMNEQAMARESFVAAAMLLLGACGCRKTPGGMGSDTVVEELNRIRPMAVRDGFEDRLEEVLSLRTNNLTDSRPVLLYAKLSRNATPEPPMVWLCVYDEDVDILGLGVQEQYIGADGESAALVEEYPVFIHRPPSGSYDYHAVPVQVRDAGQRKDAMLWDRYAAGEGIDTGRIGNVKYYRQTLPPVWMSVADLDSLDVHCYLYDRAGNRSEAVPIIRGH
jgi:hypothetical protein